MLAFLKKAKRKSRSKMEQAQDHEQVPDPVTGHKIVSQGSSGLFLVGGWNPNINDSTGNMDSHYTRTVWRYNCSTERWTQLRSDTHTAPVSLASHCVAYLNPKQLLVYGGSLSPLSVSGNSTTTYIYHTQIQTWQEMGCEGHRPPELTHHWFGQGSFLDRENELFYVSTSDISTGTMYLHRLNIPAWHWETLSDSPNEFARVREEIVVYGDRVHVLGGGRDFMRRSFDLEHIPTFSMSDETWSVVHAVPDVTFGYPAKRSCFGCVLRDHFVYIYGGFTLHVENGIRIENVDNQLWRLDLKSMQWAKFQFNLPPRWFHSIAVTPAGCLYSFGGCVTANYQGARSNEVLKVWLISPSLEELCWNVLMRKYCDNLKSLSEEELSDLGIPLEFRKRLKF